MRSATLSRRRSRDLEQEALRLVREQVDRVEEQRPVLRGEHPRIGGFHAGGPIPERRLQARLVGRAIERNERTEPEWTFAMKRVRPLGALRGRAAENQRIRQAVPVKANESAEGRIERPPNPGSGRGVSTSRHAHRPRPSSRRPVTPGALTGTENQRESTIRRDVLANNQVLEDAECSLDSWIEFPGGGIWHSPEPGVSPPI